MKQLHSALALVAFSAAMVGCTTMKQDAPKAAPAPKAAAPAKAATSDAALTAAVTAALAKEAQLKGSKVSAAATTDGEVTVTGMVKNDWQKYLAGDIAKNTTGVKSVKNSLKVDD